MPFSTGDASSVQERTPRSRDYYSAGYAKTLRRFREEQGYGVHPFSLAIWPRHDSDKLRRDDWRVRHLCVTRAALIEPAQQTVGVLIGSALPWVIGWAK